MTNNFIYKDKTPEAIEKATRAYDSGIALAKTISDDIKEARNEEISAKERASTARVEIFSNEKGKEQNRQYQEYLEGSIAENFATKVALTEERITLMQEIANMRITLAQEKAEAELAIKKRQAEADLQYEETLKKTKALKTNKLKLWTWRILWPSLGTIMAVIVYLLLNF